MNKSTINFIIEALMFLVLMGLAGIGLSLWLGRYLFGTVHFYLGLSLVGLILIHIYLHWTQIANKYHKLVDSSIKRIIIAVIYVLVSLTLLFWLVVGIFI